jgi:stage III sporulation protein AA
MRRQVDEQGRDTAQEIRLRIDLPPEIRCSKNSVWLKQTISQEDLQFVINAASKYSPWSAATSAQGYLTIKGGHRIGICGEVVLRNGIMTGFRGAGSLCIRVARDFQGISGQAGCVCGSILILGPPGSGKTTLLRDLIRSRSDGGPGSVAVVDERGELFSAGHFPSGKRTDILTGCPKKQGIEMVLRTMGPSCIAVDEITAVGDCDALKQAGWCGVSVLATAHAADKQDYFSRPIYCSLAKSGLFETLIIMKPDKSWHLERMNK